MKGPFISIDPVSTQEDLEWVEKLAREIFFEVYAETIPHFHIEYYIQLLQTPKAIQEQIDQGYEYYLTRSDQKPVGYLGINFEGAVLDLSKLYLLDSARGLGIGARAMELVADRAAIRNCQRIELIVNRLNAGAIRFYENHGFQLIKGVVNHFDNGHSEKNYLMSKNLDH